MCFWKRSKTCVPPDSNLSTAARATDVVDLETRLSKRKLVKLCESSTICEFIKRVDEQLYQILVDYLIVNVLRPIPSPLTQAIRNFAKNLEVKMKEALGSEYSIQLKRAKVI